MTTIVRTIARVALFCVVVLVAFPAAAHAQTPSGTSGEFSYHPTEGARGDSIYFDAKCLWGGSGKNVQLDVSVGQTNVGGSGFGQTYGVGSDGTIAGAIVIPSTAQSGDYIISGECRLEDQVFFYSSGPFTVTGPTLPSTTTTMTAPSTTFAPTPDPAATPTSTEADGQRQLPRTGVDMSDLVLIALAAAALGLATSFSARRRRARVPVGRAPR